MDKEIPVLESRYRRMLQLYSDYGVKNIEDFVNQRIEDQKKEWDISEDCIILGKNVKFRAQFDTYIKAFFDSLDLLFNSPIAKDYYVPAKRLGYLLIRMRDRYKDETLDLKWAGAKVRKLLDKYLASEGIDTKISPVKLLSGDFLKSVEANNKNNRAKASEMEHAIRWHIKVNTEKDPALYTKFNERLQRILDEHKENWDIIVIELEKLRDSIAAGRENDKALISVKIAPFFDLINMIGDLDKENIELQQKVAGLATAIYAYFSESLRIQNFWQKPSETRKLESKIQDELEFSGIPALKTAASQLTAELINLAKNREKEILSKNV
jgi:type I restriction enzyme R subunit